MKLKTLRLHGFKSFADRTEIAFHDGITAIVGPNGCGKSNISDAVRWVLGEQRPSAIRGAKMEEAIFQGTVNRRPVHRGSVTMELANPDGALPVPFEEVEIARTVYRDGGSDYQLNRSSCRLRDIQELCRDTGLGANAYAVIENRMIDAILSDRAEERRSLFEEAAGIGKYKDRRKAASRRLERAETDLQRLEDLIGEVESKVRSLARQKGRAERYHALRKRRLDVEMTVARSRLDEHHNRLAEVRRLLDGELEEGESLQAEVATAEARVEALRVDQVEAERARGEAAARVESLRTELVRWERELAVAAERKTHARRRLEQIEEERSEARLRADRAQAEQDELSAHLAGEREALEALQEKVAGSREEADQVRERFLEARKLAGALEDREREVTRRMAQLEGDAHAAESQAAELAARVSHLDEELTRAREALGELRSQGDLFTDRVETLAARAEELRSQVALREEEVEKARQELEAAREAEIAAQDEASALGTRMSALQRMERDREGMDPVLKALLAHGPDGVLGVLADCLSAPAPVMSAVEAYLGAVSRGVVVRDARAARRVHRWFRDEWSGGGGLILLPLDGVGEVGEGGTLLEQVETKGEGAPWVQALLAGVDLVDASGDEGEWEAFQAVPRRDRVAPDGTSRTRSGLLRLGNPLGATGLLERKEELRKLEAEAKEAGRWAESRRQARETARSALREAEGGLEETRRELREVEDDHREARSTEEERDRQRLRMSRTLEELERQAEAAATGRTRALERAEAARSERTELARQEETLNEERTRARSRLETVEEEWEEVRSRVSALAVEETRLEGEVRRLEERGRELERTARQASERLESLDREEERLKAELEAVAEVRARGEEETHRLFQERDEATTRLKERDAALESLHESLTDAEKRIRQARGREREASEVRHRLELEARELDGKLGRIQDRLEGEWGRPLERLMDEAEPVEGELDGLQEELHEIVRKLDRLGPVNMLAVEEHEEESTRLAFLRDQRDDLVDARNDLRSAIREINQTATRLFNETFEGVRENFRATFHRLFQGGESDLWLAEPDDPLESDIEIHASPRGKRTQRIDLLSGGERALTALALLFGIYLVKPSPFCVLDEVDAPLDESNIGRFIRLLQEFKDQTQFIVITHNPRTIESADWIYGVTMEEPGVSSIVGVQLDEALEVSGAPV